ncbi:MAG: sigma-54 dependent transcriptional regulator [Cyclobacteriaceae bacterium]
MENILIIDDESDICLLLEKYLSKNGYSTHSEQNGEDGIKWLKKHDTDLVICDFKLPDYNGIDILQKIKILSPKTQVIIITGYSDVKIAVEALKKGAFEYVTKPLFPDEILATVKSALEEKPTAAGEQNELSPKAKNKPATREKHHFISGPSNQSKIVEKHIDLIAPTDMSVIILGETGTGKEYVARSIHVKSSRSGNNFVAVDCGAIPKDLAGSELFGHMKGAFTGAISDKKGCFELANNGTLFLDEIGNLSYENQIKLLRVLQERVVKPVGGTKDIPVDVRVIVATNENLKDSIEEGEFREDIYHRLNEFKIELTPLRERPSDVEAFALYFLDSANQQLGKDIKGFSNEAMQTLKSYVWHGNLRELQNVVKRSVLICQGSQIEIDHLPREICEIQIANDTSSIDISFNNGMPMSLKAVSEQAEKSAIIEVLKRTNNNKTETARLLEVDRKTLYNKLKAYQIVI